MRRGPGSYQAKLARRAGGKAELRSRFCRNVVAVHPSDVMAFLDGTPRLPAGAGHDYAKELWERRLTIWARVPGRALRFSRSSARTFTTQCPEPISIGSAAAGAPVVNGKKTARSNRANL